MLGREQVEVDLEAIAAYIAGETVLVTGAGGSIGSELCRQVARLGAARLVLVDKAESALFEIERELVDERELPGGAAGARRLRRPRRRCGRSSSATSRRSSSTPPPTSTSPMLEANPLQAVANNVLATRVDRRGRGRVRRRALRAHLDRQGGEPEEPDRPVEGGLRVDRRVVRAARDDVATRFVAVRFGNVLGSSGSVIPIFRRQIERGGPVTVTHPEMTRFFMTIPEASSLVVQAGAMGGRGQVFVLDMGEPVKILDLAKQMIRLSGRSEERRSRSSSSGSRAGEKMHEELWNEGEEVGADVAPEDHARRAPADRRRLARGRAGGAGAAGRRGRHARRRRASSARWSSSRSARAAKRCSKTRSTNPSGHVSSSRLWGLTPRPAERGMAIGTIR